ncbi:MAG: sulfite exporter TauE/SafE family protein [Wenzhouxiangellaceae bacterium]
MAESLLYLLLGIAAGVLAGLLGIGGGLVIVPVLGWFWMRQGIALEQALPMAIATSLASMWFTSASSAWAHFRRAQVDLNAAWRLGPAVAVGSLAGGWTAALLPGEMLARLFALLIALIGLRMLLHASEPSAARTARPRLWWAFGPLAGALSALLGIGGGSFNVPYLRYNGYPMLVAVGTAAACGWPIAVAGTLGFVIGGWGVVEGPGQFGFVYLPAALLIGLGGFIAAPWGARLARRLGAVALARLFGLFLLAVSIRVWLGAQG